MSGLWSAIVTALVTIVLVYFSLFKILKFLYQKHLTWFVASLIFLSPFGFVLSQARDLLELLWIVLLTPFYSIFVLFIATTIWITRSPPSIPTARSANTALPAAAARNYASNWAC